MIALPVPHDKEQFVLGCALIVDMVKIMKETIPLGFLLIMIKVFVGCIADIEQP